jgi:hypothetical protein
MNITSTIISENFTMTIGSGGNRRFAFASADVLHFKTVYRHPKIPLMLTSWFSFYARKTLGLTLILFPKETVLASAGTVGRPHGITK